MTLPSGDRADQLRSGFRSLGMPDDEVDSWVSSELEGNVPQLARYRFLRQMWPQMIDNWRDELGREPVARKLLEAGVDERDLVQVARAVAYHTVFAMLYYLEDDRLDRDDLPYWALMEMTGDDEPTGRRVSALFESLMSMDPSGREGSDLLPRLPGPWTR